jgi:hypothetical protein
VKAGQLIENELTFQADRLATTAPSTEDEAVYLEDLMNGYRNAAVYVNRMWTHQAKRLERMKHDQADGADTPYLPAIDEHGRAIAHTEG